MAGEETGARRERERDLDRLLTFIDAIVAIAITLLVIPLVDVAASIEDHQSVVDLLRDHRGELWTFLLSFVVISKLWFAQHRAVRSLVSDHRAVSLLLMTWSLTIVFLPFPTALVAGAGDQALTKILYIGTMALSTALVAAIDILISHHPEITDQPGSTDPWSAVVSAGLFVVALVISLLIPATSYFPLFLLATEPWITKFLKPRFPALLSS